MSLYGVSNRPRPYLGHDGDEDILVAFVVDSVSEGEIDGVVFALSGSDVSEVSGAGEIFSIFVEGNSHDAVRRVESFFDAVAVVNVDIDIQDPMKYNNLYKLRCF